MKNIAIMTIPSLEYIDAVAKEFLSRFEEDKIFAFYADMGKGKTTFIRALCRVLGVKNDVVNSPTFSIVNEYVSEKGETVYHFDCYRLESVHDALNIGADDYLNSNGYCFIEWPEVLEPILPDNTVIVEIESEGDLRILKVHHE